MREEDRVKRSVDSEELNPRHARQESRADTGAMTEGKPVEEAACKKRHYHSEEGTNKAPQTARPSQWRISGLRKTSVERGTIV